MANRFLISGLNSYAEPILLELPYIVQLIHLVVITNFDISSNELTQYEVIKQGIKKNFHLSHDYGILSRK